MVCIVHIKDFINLYFLLTSLKDVRFYAAIFITLFFVKVITYRSQNREEEKE